MASLAASGHVSQLAQDAQLLGDRTWLAAGHRGQLVDGELVLDQREEDPNPALGAEGAHVLGDFGRLGGVHRRFGRTVLQRMRHWWKVTYPHSCAAIHSKQTPIGAGAGAQWACA